MEVLGIDLGGTKIEAQVFDRSWKIVDRRRVETPRDYPALIAAIAAQIAWADGVAGRRLPVGISAAGLVNPATGLALTANLPATGKPLPADIDAAAGRRVTIVNDCRALALSEAVFGAGRGASPVLGLILGTGVGGGVAVGRRLLPGLAHVGGEFGHMPAPAALVARHGLPVVTCGCGIDGCIETLIAGPGVTRLATALTGRALTPQDIGATRHTDPDAARVWEVWTALVAEHLRALCLALDPEIVVIAGGLSQMPGLCEALAAALDRVHWPGFARPRIALAEGGETSGARGAAYAALGEMEDA